MSSRSPASSLQAHVQKALRDLETWLQLLTHAESEALRNPHLSGLLADLQWPQQHWPRRILLGLWECEFAMIPQDLRGELTQWNSCFKTSKTCEYAFNICRDKERSSRSGIVEPRSVWGHIRDSWLATPIVVRPR